MEQKKFKRYAMSKEEIQLLINRKMKSEGKTWTEAKKEVNKDIRQIIMTQHKTARDELERNPWGLRLDTGDMKDPTTDTGPKVGTKANQKRALHEIFWEEFAKLKGQSKNKQ